MSVAISLDSILQKKVQHIVDLQHSSFDSVVRQALSEYVEREEKKIAFQQEALSAWQDFQQNGLHLTGDEVETWLKTWGTDKETEIPKCHN